MTNMGTAVRQAGRAGGLSVEASALWEKFPPRPVPVSWEATCQDRAAVLDRLLTRPFVTGTASTAAWRRLGLLRIMDWLQAQPGRTWQERWNAAVDIDGTVDWRIVVLRWLKDTSRIAENNTTVGQALGTGLTQLICGDVVRPDLCWLLTSATPRNLAGELARVRDTGGFKALAELKANSLATHRTSRDAIEWVAYLLAAKGGLVRDITVGDSLELLAISDRRGGSTLGGRGTSFYQLLHALGSFPAGAPAAVRMFHSTAQGQRTVEHLIDQYDIANRPVRDLLVDYLRERQPGIDYATLNLIATALGRSFWKDLELHHPGIDSLRLAPDIAAAWKQRTQTRTVRMDNGCGERVETQVVRESAANTLMTVRAFYLDIAHWAADDPARWGPWVVPCPIRDDDSRYRKQRAHRKSRMDQRTRERLPVLPVLIAVIDQARKDTAKRLEAARCTEPGGLFAIAGQTLRRSKTSTPSPRIWAEDLDTKVRRDLIREERNAFWTWAAVEVLRMTGIRIEELTELSHHSLVQYRLPGTGELIPLLHIAPSKTDEERLLVISPELADILSMILCRVRGDSGVPLVGQYDPHEKIWNPPLPLLFQHRVGVENRSFHSDTIRGWINQALADTDLTDASGKPLRFVPHDFRRIFTTDALLNGMPPHIAQLILGHRDINTTMGYKAIYPEEAIKGHRAFIARRRELRPSEEYRTPTDEEWDEFLGHFERRRVALGDCGRAFGTPCIHEHSCIRCPLLRPDPVQRPRLTGIRDNLNARIEEAQREGWTGEAEGLKVSLAAANAKLAQLDGLNARREAAVHLGIPAFRHIAGRTTDPGKDTA